MLNSDRVKYEDTVWIVLHEVEGIYEPISSSYEKPTDLADGDIAIKGYRGKYARIEYGVERYFVPEGTAEPDRDETTVKLDVYKGGEVRINQVYVKDKAWP